MNLILVVYSTLLIQLGSSDWFDDLVENFSNLWDGDGRPDTVAQRVDTVATEFEHFTTRGGQQQLMEDGIEDFGEWSDGEDGAHNNPSNNPFDNNNDNDGGDLGGDLGGELGGELGAGGAAAAIALPETKYGNRMKCYPVVGRTPVKVKKGQLMKQLYQWGEEYSIQIDIKVKSWINSWGSIFRFTSIDGNCCKIGQRIPLLGTQEDGLLQIFTEFGGNFRLELGKFQKDKWYHLLIYQRNHHFSVYVDNVRKVLVRNDNPKKFYNVNVFASDKYHDNANVEIKNFHACEIWK